MSKEADFQKLHSLAGLVQKIAQDCKTGLPLFDELVLKTTKLQTQLVSTTTVLGSFLDTFQKLADSATSTKGSSTDIGICLTRIVIRHRAIEAHLRTLTRALSDCFTYPIQNKVDEWRGTVKQIDREHTREFKKMRSLIKKKSDQIIKLRKKGRKENNVENSRICDVQVQELNSLIRTAEDKEKQVVRRMAAQERTHYTALAASFKPIIGEEYEMLLEIEQLTEVMDKLTRIISDPRRVVETSENVVSLLDSAKERFCYATPPSSPAGSTMGSRRGSLRSLTSTSSSRTSSTSRLSYHESSTSTPISAAASNPDSRSRNDSYSSDTEVLSKPPSWDSLTSARSQDSGFPSSTFSSSSSYTPLVINEEDLQRTPTREGVNLRSKTESRQKPAVSGRPPLPSKPRPVVPDRSSSLDGGSRTTSPQGVNLDSISLQNSFSSHGISALYQGRVDLNPVGRTGRTSPGAGIRISPSLYSNLQLRNSFYTKIPSRDGFSSEDGSNPYPEQRLPESHYGVPRSTPVLTNPPRSSPMDSKDQRYNHKSEYSVPKPILPNFSLDKLDMVLPLPIYMNTQMARPNQDLEKSGNPENTRNQGYAENPQYIQNPGEGLDGSKIIHPDQLGRRAGLGLRGELMLRVDLENEDELITPTIEQLSILEEKVDEGRCYGLDTSSGSGSMGSSSGYGSTGFEPNLDDTLDLGLTGGTAGIGGRVQESNLESNPGDILHKYQDNSLGWSSSSTSGYIGGTPGNSVTEKAMVYSGSGGSGGIYGVETLNGTLKRSHSVGVSQPTTFDRQHPMRQSLAGELERTLSGDMNGVSKGRNLRSFVEKSFIPKPNKSKPQGKSSDHQSGSQLPRHTSTLLRAQTKQTNTLTNKQTNNRDEIHSFDKHGIIDNIFTM